MESDKEELDGLRESLVKSPDDAVLRGRLAAALLRTGAPEEAEQEYRKALARSPGNVRLKFGLAETYRRRGKNSAALVILKVVGVFRRTGHQALPKDVLRAPSRPGLVFEMSCLG